MQVWTVMLLCVGLTAIVNVLSYNSTFQIIRTSTTAENLGVANGISQSLVALARGVGPAIGTSSRFKCLLVYHDLPPPPPPFFGALLRTCFV